MTFPEVHLAAEAVVAFVDGELGSPARARAEAHVDHCAECRAAVEAQREASRLLAGAPDPVVPPGLTNRLREIPMTADLGGSDVVLAVEDGDLVWNTASPGRSTALPGGSRRPAGGRRGGRTGSRAPGSGPVRRSRRALYGAMAGLAFGVCVATASASIPARTAGTDRTVIRDVNGGVVRPPITGELTGVSDLRHPSVGQRSFRRDGPDGIGRPGTGVDSRATRTGGAHPQTVSQEVAHRSAGQTPDGAALYPSDGADAAGTTPGNAGSTHGPNVVGTGMR